MHSLLRSALVVPVLLSLTLSACGESEEVKAKRRQETAEAFKRMMEDAKKKREAEAEKRKAEALGNEPIKALPEKVEADAAKVALGRRLYHDDLLSGDGTISCATCHGIATGGAEPRKVSTGIKGQQGPINAPTVFNASFNFVQFWDGRAKDLKEQAAGPVANPGEMGAEWPKVVEAVQKDERYQKDFAAAYGGKIDQDTITDAIAEYEKTLITPSRVDKFLRGDAAALTDQEKAGYALFKSVGCTTCHQGVNVGGSMYQKMGLVKDYFAARGTPLTEADNGRFNVTKAEGDKHFFKVPTLRNVERTAPYFHDGSHDTLEAAVKTMASVQLAKDLKDDEVAAISAFLRALSGDVPADAALPEGDLPKDRLSPEPPAAAAAPAEGDKAAKKG